MATLYVNPDSGGASDAGDYTAAQSESTPLKTIAQAMTLAELGDTIAVRPAVTANPADSHGQTDVYAWTPDETFGGTTITHKDASAGMITVQGIVVGNVRPKWFGTSTRFMKNWKFNDFQVGYSPGSGFEYNTATTWLGCEDLHWSGCYFTGGVANVLGFYGHNRLENCEIVSRLSADPGGFMEGVGIRLLASYDTSTHAGPNDWWEFSGCDFHDVQGEDGIQVLGGVDFGNVLAEDCTFNNLSQSGVAHTDAIQSTGITELIVRRCKFGETGLVASMVIGTDGPIGTLTLDNNLFVGRPGAGFSTQFGGGVRNAIIRHNTWVNSVFGGLRFHRQTAGHEPVGSSSLVMCNNLIDRFQVDQTVTWGAGDQFNNVITIGPATAADFVGTPEYGTSADTGYELSNTPVDAMGVDQGAITTLTTDRLGRSRKGAAPDCGCHESNPAVAVATSPRPPILISVSPAGGASGVAGNVNVSATLYPKPGETLDAATVTPASFYVTDPSGQHLPIIGLTVGAPVSGQQTIGLDIDGELYPYVTYTVTVTSAVADTGGSAFTGASWAFRVAGPVGAAVYHAGAPAQGGWLVGVVL